MFLETQEWIIGECSQGEYIQDVEVAPTGEGCAPSESIGTGECAPKVWMCCFPH